MTDKTAGIRLVRKDGIILLHLGAEAEGVPVTVVWARPVSGRGKEVSFLDGKKREVLMIESLAELDAESRAIAEEALEGRYLIPKINRVLKAEVHFGNRFWDVETTLGRRSFAMRDPNTSVTRLSSDHLILRDVLGNCYEIPSLSELDDESRNRAEMVL